MIGTTSQYSSGENPSDSGSGSDSEMAQSNIPTQTPITPPSEPENSSKPAGFNLITSVALVITLVFALIAIAVYVAVRAKQASLKKIDTEIAGVNQQINQKPDLEKAITAIYGQVTNLDSVLAQRNFWSQFIKEISDKNTLKAQYLSINAQDLNKVQITGRAESYISLAYVVKSFQNSKYFSKVTVTNSSKETAENSSVNFTIEAAMSQSLLSKETPKTNSSTQSSNGTSSTETQNSESTSSTNETENTTTETPSQ